MLGQRIKQLRKERGWSQRELARRSGVHSHTISNYERGERGVNDPPLFTVQALARALDVPLANLLDEDPEVAATA